MKIVHIITDLEIAGAELMLARLLERLDRSRIENAVISLSTKGALGDRMQAAGVPVFALGLRPGRPDPIALWRLVRLLRRLRPEVVQTWLYHADLAGLVAGTLARTPKVVWNIRSAELDPRDHPRSLSALLRMLAIASRWTSVVVCNSNAGRRAHEALGYRPLSWEIIPNGFDVQTFRPDPDARAHLRRELGIDDSTRVVGVLARFHPMKDHPTFLRAAADVARQRDDVHFVAAGRGVGGNEALMQLVREHRLESRVHLWPQRPDAHRLLAAFDVAVISSYGEAFPNVIGEAMACGTPCVVTDVGDSALLVGDTGVVVSPRAPSRLAEGILKILDLSPESRAALGLAARARIVAEFSLDRAARRYEQLYFKVAGQAASAGERLCVE